VCGDLALFQALGHLLLQEEQHAPDTVVDVAFIEAQTDGFEAYCEARREVDWQETEKATGLLREQVDLITQRLQLETAAWGKQVTHPRTSLGG
jgi:formate dehydrogenase major subunit